MCVCLIWYVWQVTSHLRMAASHKLSSTRLVAVNATYDIIICTLKFMRAGLMDVSRISFVSSGSVELLLPVPFAQQQQQHHLRATTSADAIHSNSSSSSASSKTSQGGAPSSKSFLSGGGAAGAAAASFGDELVYSDMFPSFETTVSVAAAVTVCSWY